MGVWKTVKHEITGRRLLWNILFYGGHIGLFIYGWWKQKATPELAGLNTLKYSVWISRGAGLCLGVDGLLLILPVIRSVIKILRPFFTWLAPLDENIWFHRQIAYSMLFWTIVHTTAHYVNMFNVERTQIRKEMAWSIMYTQPGGFTGHMMLLIMLLMYTTAHHKIREQCFEAFIYTHQLAFFFLLALYTHAVGCFVRGALPGEQVRCLGYDSWRWTIIGGIAYYLERIYRELRSRRSTRIVGVLMHPCGAMEIRFEKPAFRYKSGHWLFLNVPEIARFQWHPFTISSAPDDPYISVHIRQAGDFTKALGARLGCTPEVLSDVSPETGSKVAMDSPGGYFDISRALVAAQTMPTLRIDGPYGAPAEDVFKHEVAVLIGTGIGVTPFASILKNIWYMQQKRHLGRLRRVQFIWCNRDTGSFEWFQILLKRLEEAQTDPEFLRINMYLTQKLDADTIHNIVIQDVGTEFDALTKLRSRTQFGRPDWTAIFRNLRESIEMRNYLPNRDLNQTTKIGIFYCGPNPLGKTVREKAFALNNKSVKFSFFKEHF